MDNLCIALYLPIVTCIRNVPAIFYGVTYPSEPTEPSSYPGMPQYTPSYTPPDENESGGGGAYQEIGEDQDQSQLGSQTSPPPGTAPRGPTSPLTLGLPGGAQFIGYLDRIDIRAKNADGCYPIGGGGGSDTCRKQENYESILIGHNYGIKAQGHVGTRTGNQVKGLKTSITSGGPGSTDANCCGITVGVNNDTGHVFIATEDWSGPSGKKTVLCGDGKPNCPGDDGTPITGLGKDGLYGQDISLEWHYRNQGGNHIYTGIANGKTFSYTNPKDTHGNPIIPQHYIHGQPKKNGDPTRFRIDGSMNSTLGQPAVYLE